LNRFCSREPPFWQQDGTVFERPLGLTLLVLMPLLAADGIAALRRGHRRAGLISCILRCAGFATLVMLIAGLKIRSSVSASQQAIVVAIDQSGSIASDQSQWMRSQIAQLRGAMDPRDRLAVVGFGSDVRLLAPMEDPRMVRRLDGAAQADSTDLERAITASMGLFGDGFEKKIVLLSDGNQTKGNVLAEVPEAAAQSIRIFTSAPPPSSIERIALTSFETQSRVRAKQSFGLRIGVESEAKARVEAKLKVSIDGNQVGSRSVTLHPGLNRLAAPYVLGRAGAYLLGVELEATAPYVLANARAELPISVLKSPRILVVSGEPPDSLISALKLRGYELERAIPRALPARAEDLLAYQSVILANVSADAIAPSAQAALARYVSDYGGGLVATGDSLRDYKFAGSQIEKALPINFEHQPPPPSREPLAIYLCIDRSNSMSYNSRYPAVRDGERIRYAKQAAIALLRQLDDTDYAGVIAFDSQPYVLSRLRPLGEDRAQLEDRVERLEPGGGTDFKDSLEMAEREILDSKLGVRQVILITDGDTNRQYHDHDALIADFADKHIPVSTIRIGPDLANLRLLEDFAQATGGLFYRVQDIERLPQLLVRLTRKAMDQSPQGSIAIKAGGRSAILDGIPVADIPRLEFFTTTAPKTGASVPLRIERSKESVPLIASWQYGLGRTAIFAADTDTLAALSWIRWDRYAQFWSQLVTWTMRSDPGMFDIAVEQNADQAIEVRAEKADAAGPASNLVCRITGAGASLDLAMTQTGDCVYTGSGPTLPRGKYTATLMNKAGEREEILASNEFAVASKGAAGSAELKLLAPNLALLRQLAAETGGGFGESPAEVARRRGAKVTIRRSAESILVPIAIALVLGEIFVRRRFAT
jgi:Mg-chelatase subunit ChlD